MSDYVICPKCRGEDVVVLTLVNYATGTRVVYTCDSCAVRFQVWQPRPVSGAR